MKEPQEYLSNPIARARRYLQKIPHTAITARLENFTRLAAL